MMNWLVRAALALPLLMVMGFGDYKIDASNAERLDASLQSILRDQPQADQKMFLELFFMRAYYENCLVNGHDYSHKQVRGPEACAEEIAGWPLPAADAYLSNRRMDDNHAYVRSNVFGSSHHGYSARQSIVMFIDKYGEYVHGLSAREIVVDGAKLYKQGRSALDATKQAEAADAIPAMEAKLAELKANYQKIAKVAPQRFLEREQDQCQRAINKTTYLLSVLVAARDGSPIPEKPPTRTMSHTRDACVRVRSKWKGGPTSVMLSDWPN